MKIKANLDSKYLIELKDASAYHLRCVTLMSVKGEKRPLEQHKTIQFADKKELDQFEHKPGGKAGKPGYDGMASANIDEARVIHDPSRWTRLKRNFPGFDDLYRKGLRYKEQIAYLKTEDDFYEYGIEQHMDAINQATQPKRTGRPKAEGSAKA